MNADELPLNSTMEVANGDHFRSTATRISNDTVEITYFDKATGDITLIFHGSVDGLRCEILKLDTIYWTISINGRPATQQDVSEIYNRIIPSFSASAEDRKIELTM